MTGHDETGGDGPRSEAVGSVAEEAAKLLEALQGWATDGGADAGGLGARLREVDEHLATGAEECRYCPLCRAVGYLRQTSPEVRGHLTDAATSLLHAGAAFLETRAARTAESQAGRPEEPTGVERIDLDDDVTWDAD